eukprot:977689-Pelagomonas_calceolata.AAC.1
MNAQVLGLRCGFVLHWIAGPRHRRATRSNTKKGFTLHLSSLFGPCAFCGMTKGALVPLRLSHSFEAFVGLRKR